MIWMYIISVIVAYFLATVIWDVRGDDIKIWKCKLEKYVIYILLSSIFIWPFSLLILLIWIIVFVVKDFFVDVYKMIRDIFKL